MTVCAVESAVDPRDATGRHGLVIAADGSYAARLTMAPGTREGWFPERWTLGGPEPYAVPLPGAQPEESGSRVLPLADGRVLLARPVAGRHDLVLLYPSGPRTSEVPLGSVPDARLRLLPPTPGGRSVYALTQTDGPETVTAVWQVTDGRDGSRPQQVARLAGVCAGGAWLDPDGRLLALDRTEPPGSGGGRPRTKTVVVDVADGGAVTPLLELTEDSDDRLLLADPDSGLLLVRSDAPGTERLGWCVLGSERPVRFPEALAPDGVRLTPFAVQPGQVLLPETCGVALRVDRPRACFEGSVVHSQGGRDGVRRVQLQGGGARAQRAALSPENAGDTSRRRQGEDVRAWRHPADGTFETRPGTWAAVWRPDGRVLQHVAAPHGWFSGAGLWTADGELRLPCSDVRTPCALARIRPGIAPASRALAARAARPALPAAAEDRRAERTPAAGMRPVPLQQAPMARAR